MHWEVNTKSKRNQFIDFTQNGTLKNFPKIKKIQILAFANSSI